VATVPGKRAISDPDLRDRLYELLEHDHLPHSVGSRFVRLIVTVIVVDVLAAILASVPEYDAKLHRLFTAIEVAAVLAFALEYLARIWSVVGHSLRDMTPMRARLEYALSALGIIDLLAFLPSMVALFMRDRHALVLFGMLPFLKLVRYSPALRSLLAALHAERRTLFGCLVILTGAVLLFASLLFAIEHTVQPEKFGTIPQAMVVGDRHPRHRRLWRRGAGDAARQDRFGVHHRGRIRDDRAAGRDHLDRVRRGSAAARFRRHLGHAGAGAAVLASRRLGDRRHHAAVAGADHRIR
jgi:hypothetical protein